MKTSQKLSAILNARILSKGDKTSLFTLKIRGAKIDQILPQKVLVKSSEPYGTLDAGGSLVLPGLIDSHAHLFSLAMNKRNLDLRKCKSIKELQERLSNFVKSPEVSSGKIDWIQGRGWDQDLFRESRFPSRHDLDIVERKRPILLERICGHIAVLNTAGIVRVKSLLNLSEELTPREIDGNLSGLVKETALDHCRSVIPAPSQHQLLEDFLSAQDEAMSNGLIGVHCILSENWSNELGAIKELDRKGKVKISLDLFLPISAIGAVESLSPKNRKEFLRGDKFKVVGFKLFADGSLGARTAALEEPYADDLDNSGVLYHKTSVIEEYSRRIKSLQMIFATHAIGDRAINQVISAYKNAGVTKFDNFRIEHCSVVNRKFLRHLRDYTISVQPSFCTSDYWITQRLGENSKRIAYPLRSLSHETTLIGGSDAPVENIDPLAGICAATQNPFEKKSLSLFDALKLYSVNAGGSWISKGKDCNLLILSISSPKEICKAKVKQIIVQGKNHRKDTLETRS